ncbi:hypothetical protein F1880_000118 [Penicillium rolfsii]|nr:hypothetical protein F1880_000118 [Penicillium rolfsii]
MSSSIAMSSVALARPGTTRPVLSHLVATHTSRSHGIWHSARSARSYHSIRDKMERIARSIDKYQRHPQANLRSKAEACNGWPATAHRDSSSSKGWATHWPRSRFSELAGREKTYWDVQHEQMNHRIAHLKRQIAKDPYEALFGGFLRTFLGAEKPTTEHPSKAHRQDSHSTQSPDRFSVPDSRDALEYDPVSGRMAPKAPQSQTGRGSTMASSNAGVDCLPGSEVEAKFASNPSSMEDSQFQPSSIMTAKKDAIESQTVDCSPGSEVETLLISKSPRSEKPQPETTRAQTRPGELSADDGLSFGQNVECAPGGEVKALFTAEPATQNGKSRPAQSFGYQPPANVCVDSSSGSEMEAHFAAQLEKDCNSEPKTTIVDCIPDSELEAKIVAETTRAQFSDPAVDCAPGSELEALFTTNPAAVQASHYPATMATADSVGKQAETTVECGPGNEIEAKFASDSASTVIHGESEDLTALHAGDIRARYTVTDDDTSVKSHNTKDVKINPSEDRAGDFLQTQPSTTTQAWSQADYRILAYDTTTSTVTTTSADTFFGTNPPMQAHEILSRLHNPAKFIPYFTSMQKDGYELATGGGDILVFKRSTNNKNTTTSMPAAGQHEIYQESMSDDIHADIERYRSHDSFDSTSFVRHYNPSSTVKPSTSGHESSRSSHNSNSNSSSSPGSTSDLTSSTTKPKSKSTFRGVIRRMILTGTITAASCYAIGVLTEYFRTGGLDGRGADAFTTFESDRLHRE